MSSQEGSIRFKNFFSNAMILFYQSIAKKLMRKYYYFQIILRYKCDIYNHFFDATVGGNLKFFF
jgi:hypothetical protein